MNLPECKLSKTHKEIVRIMVFSTPCLKDGQATSNTKARAPLPGFSRVIWDEWGKKGVRMDTKALKKQMGAAIAMVLVAAVALGSATFAWFVSNNKVEAKTASVSAQSNAPFLKIGLPSDKELTKTEETQTAGADEVVLYPSQWNHVVNPDTYQFESAYASDAKKSDMLAKSRFAVGGVDAPTRSKYALKQSFKIGTTDEKAGSFQNLKVASVTVNAGEKSDGLKSAICVLVKCGDQWGVYKGTTDGTELTAYVDETAIVNRLTGKAGTNVSDALAAEIGANKTVDVDVYVFYDGSASTVFSDNLANLKNCGVTVAFTATPVNTDGNAVDVG